MNIKKLCCSFILAAAALTMGVQASAGVVVYSEDFSGFADGDSVNGVTTSVGNGTFITSGPVVVDANGRLIIDTALAAGRDQIQIDTPTSVSVAQLTFDLERLVDGNSSDSVFTQATVGGRSTGGSPIPNFAASLIGNAFDNGAVQVTYVANSTGAAFSYTAPDGSSATVAASSLDLYVGNSVLLDDSSGSGNGAGTPSAIQSFVIQTFNGQNGNVYAFDNFELTELVKADAVPEPSSAVALLAIGAVTLVRRRRR